MELTRQNQNHQSESVFNEDFFWGFPFVAGKPLVNAQSWAPAIDVSEDQTSYTIKADLPGLKKEDVRISLEEGILTIEGERKVETEHKDKSYHRFERSYGRFARSLNVGNAVDESKIKASYKDGVLEIIAPKAEKARARTIDIDVN
jgi:HSP20 family protein